MPTAAAIEEWAVSVRKKWRTKGLDKKREGSHGFRHMALVGIAQHAVDMGYVTDLGDTEAERVAYAETIIKPPKTRRAKSPAKEGAAG